MQIGEPQKPIIPGKKPRNAGDLKTNETSATKAAASDNTSLMREISIRNKEDGNSANNAVP